MISALQCPVLTCQRLGSTRVTVWLFVCRLRCGQGKIQGTRRRQRWRGGVGPAVSPVPESSSRAYARVRAISAASNSSSPGTDAWPPRPYRLSVFSPCRRGAPGCEGGCIRQGRAAQRRWLSGGAFLGRRMLQPVMGSASASPHQSVGGLAPAATGGGVRALGAWVHATRRPQSYQPPAQSLRAR